MFLYYRKKMQGNVFLMLRALVILLNGVKVTEGLAKRPVGAGDDDDESTRCQKYFRWLKYLLVVGGGNNFRLRPKIRGLVFKVTLWERRG